jgi:hypothetical protein
MYKETLTQFRKRIKPPYELQFAPWMIWDQPTYDSQNSQGRPWELPEPWFPAEAMEPNMSPMVYKDGAWFSTTEIRATLICMAVSASISVVHLFGVREAALTILAASSTARAGRFSRERMIQALLFATGISDGWVSRPTAKSDDGSHWTMCVRQDHLPFPKPNHFANGSKLLQEHA